ncbi:hypothetical protein MERGE_000206 [Pneumocystis wakefieldiae]|uniref:Cyclin N-terminal domain-containing protein n=1 Tax=Pneumocystis wakefieldiae TaxID=38082 RepID=A0A899FQJ6_9ASCO|nr:hypothetical protein MERGE_000206 [Pneumocystis wakefieldiae]
MTEDIRIPFYPFFILLSSILRLPEETTMLASIYYHKYYRWLEKVNEDNSLRLLDDYTLAIASLSLASKATEQFRRMREFLVPAYSILNPTKPRLTFPSEFYDSLRDSIVNAELLLLRVVKFDLRIILPFSYLEKALNLTLATWETETTESTLNKDACLMNTSLGRYVRCCIMDAYIIDFQHCMTRKHYQVHVYDAVDDLIQLNLKRRVGRESSDSQMNISKKQCYNIQD